MFDDNIKDYMLILKINMQVVWGGFFFHENCEPCFSEFSYKRLRSSALCLYINMCLCSNTRCVIYVLLWPSLRWPLHSILSERYQWPVVRVWWSVCNGGPWDGRAERRGLCPFLQVRHVRLTLNGLPAFFLLTS